MIYVTYMSVNDAKSQVLKDLAEMLQGEYQTTPAHL